MGTPRKGNDASVGLPTVGGTLALAEIYEQVTFS